MKKYQEDNEKLKKQSNSGAGAREMIVQLREENKKLHDKLLKINPGRQTPNRRRHTPTYQDDNDEKDARHRFLDRYGTSNAPDRYKLPDRPNDTTGVSRFSHQDMSNGSDYDRQPYIGKRSKSADFFASREGRNTRYEAPQRNEHSYTTPMATNIKDIMNLYSTNDRRGASNRHRRSTLWRQGMLRGTKIFITS